MPGKKQMETFFDTLPADGLAAVLRHYAKSGRARASKLHQLLFAAESPFSRALPACFSSLRLCNATRCDVLGGELKLDPCDELDVMRVLGWCGRVFDSVVFGDYYGDRSIDIEHVIGRFVRPGAELKILLSMHRNVELEHMAIEAMKAVGGSVHVVMPNRAMIQRFTQWQQLRRFSWRGNDASVLSKLWPCVGHTLEEVQLFCPVYSENTWGACLRLLQTHCRGLTSIRLQDPLEDSEVTEDMYAEFLMSYGERLRHAAFYSNALSAAFFQRVGTRCTKLRCLVEEDRNRFERIAALHTMIDELELTLYEMNDTSAMAEAMACCQNLVSLRVMRHERIWSPMNDDYIHALFESKLSWLERLHVYCILYPSSLRLIAAGTSNLRVVGLQFLTLAPELDEFRELANANPLLEQVTIEEKSEDDLPNMNVVRVVEGLLDAFQGCRMLKCLRMYFYSTKLPEGNALLDVCSKYRIRPFDIKISFRDTIFAPYQKLFDEA